MANAATRAVISTQAPLSTTQIYRLPESAERC
jgi:hypothetical protein